MTFKEKLRKHSVDLTDMSNTYAKILIYADSGIGKTVLSGTASTWKDPNLEPLKKEYNIKPYVFFVSLERGVLSLKNKQFADIIDLTAINCQELENFADFNDYYEFLYTHRAAVKKFLAYAKAGDKEKAEKALDFIYNLEFDGERGDNEVRIYHTIVIDSITENQKRSMDRILAIKYNEGTGGTFGAKVDFDTKNAATLPDYGTNTNQLRKLVRAFRDMEINVVYTALLGTDEDKDSGRINEYRPALTDKLAQDVKGFVDVIGYYFLDNGKDKNAEPIRRLMVQPIPKYMAKDRSGSLGKVVNNPTIPMIFGKVIDGLVKIENQK